MCGIAGIIVYGHSPSPVDREELLRVRERMHSRGPDGEGLWISEDRRIGLAHRRLAIIDLTEAGAQPMLDPDTGNRIVFNGEIYNYQSLRAELEATGHRFLSHSDTEVLLKLYAVHGQNMVKKLRGMYAFAIWDSRKGGVFLARDPFGIKPLYLSDDGRCLRFASQVKALLAGGQIDTTPEPAGHVGFFVWGSVPEPYTLYKGIRALPAGNSLWIESGGKMIQKQFFSLTEELKNAESDRESIRIIEARERLHTALLDSISHHMIADVPVGVFLSAGLDSATVAALAMEAGVKELRTFTLGFREFENTLNDEVALAEAVARQYGATHQSRWVQKEDFTAQFDHLIDAMDQPSIDGVNSYFVCKAVHEAGLKVALSGLGGDELFAGYSDFQAIPRMVRWLRPFSVVPGMGRGFRWIAAPMTKRFISPKVAGLLEYGGDYAGAYLLRRGFFMPWELPEVLPGELVRDGWRELKTLSSLRHTTEGLDNPRLAISALETSWYMRNQLLRDIDWASMAHSLEVRVPLVDIELMRTVVHLINNGQAPDKEAMAGSPKIALPQAVLQRRKTGFSVPVREWLLKSDPDSTGATKRGLRGWSETLYAKVSATA